MSVTSYIFGRKYGANFLKGLVAYYPLNSNANDLSGNAHNGSLIGSPTFVSGKVDNAIDFANDTVSRYINIPDNDDFSFTNGATDIPFTISMWVNFSGFSTTGNWLINKRNATSGGDEWQFVYFQNRLQFFKFQFNTNAIAQNIGSGLLPFVLSTWYHVAYTDNGTGLIGSGKLYINGVDVTTVNQNIGGTYTRMNNGTSLTRVGVTAWVTNESVKHRGLIDETAIWKNRELSAEEVLELYNKGNAGLPLI